MNNIMPILRQLFAAYPSSMATDGTIAQYLRLLQRIPPAELQTIVDVCVSTHKFLPTIAELFDRWHLMHRDPNIQSAIDAWGCVVAAIAGHGYQTTPKFKNPLVTRIVHSMGWQNLCISENQMADRAHFLRAYDDLLARMEEDRRLTPEFKQLRDTKRAQMLPIANILSAILGNPPGAENNHAEPTHEHLA